MTQPNDDQPKLTSQELNILKHLAEDQPNRSIADRLCLSRHTIKNHKANLKKKLGLSSTLALYRYAIDWLRKATKSGNGGGSVYLLALYNQYWVL